MTTIQARLATGDEAAAALHTVLDFARWAATELALAGATFGQGTTDAWDDACILMCGLLELDPDRLGDCGAARLLPSERARIIQAVRRRIEQRVPVAYLTGRAWYGGRRFEVTPDVLIPRSPIAELIQDDRLADPESPPQRILDLCCGSGCIGILAAGHWPDARVDLADASAAALAVADRNCVRHGLQARCRTLRSDLFDALAGQRYDLILCNPPYVDPDTLAALPAEFSHEPRMALKGGGADGLELVQRILDQAGAHLAPDGLLVLEVGDSAGLLLQARAELRGTWPAFERGGHGVIVLAADELPGPAGSTGQGA